MMATKKEKGSMNETIVDAFEREDGRRAEDLRQISIAFDENRSLQTYIQESKSVF